MPQHAPPPMTRSCQLRRKLQYALGRLNQAAAPAETSAAPARSLSALSATGASAQAGGDALPSRAAVHVGGFGDQTVAARRELGRRDSQKRIPIRRSRYFLSRNRSIRWMRGIPEWKAKCRSKWCFLRPGRFAWAAYCTAWGMGWTKPRSRRRRWYVSSRPRARGVPVDTPATIRITFELT